jgi:hypothetical protein
MKNVNYIIRVATACGLIAALAWCINVQAGATYPTREELSSAIGATQWWCSACNDPENCPGKANLVGAKCLQVPCIADDPNRRGACIVDPLNPGTDGCTVNAPNQYDTCFPNIFSTCDDKGGAKACGQEVFVSCLNSQVAITCSDGGMGFKCGANPTPQLVQGKACTHNCQ